MKGLIKWWASNHVAANLLMIAIFIAGMIGYSTMAREFFPTFPYPGMQITVVWPGAAPQEVEEQLVERIEETLKGLEGINYTESVSREGVAEVRVFAETSSDFSKLLDEVKARVDGIPSFPPSVESPQVIQFTTRQEIIRVVVHGDIDEKRLSNLAEDLRREVIVLDGVSEVGIFGSRREEVSIEVSEVALQRYNISFDQIANAVRANSINLSAGSMRTDSGTYSLRTRSLANDAQQFEDIIIRQSASAGIVRIGDVATVNDGFEEDEILAMLNGEPAVLLQVMSSENMDIIETSRSVTAWVETKRDHLPAGVSLSIWTDMSIDFTSRMKTIGWSAGSGLLLVFIILFLTLRPKVAMWVSIGIATAFSGAFVLLPAVGASLNMLSTFAFLLVLGVVVDDAIIIGERVHSEFEEGVKGIEGAVKGTIDVHLPVIFGVLTTIIAFMPWLFISGPMQTVTKQIAWVVILALTFSLIEALFILPAHLSNLKTMTGTSRLQKMQQSIAGGILSFGRHRYGPRLSAAIARPWLTSSVFAGLLIIGFVGLMGADYIKSSFMPEVESEEIYINIDLRDGTTFERALEILDQMQHAQEELKAEVENNGVEGKNKIVENWYTRSRRDSVIAIVKLASPELRTMSAKEAAIRLRELIGDVPEARAVQVRYSFEGGGPDMQFAVRHTDLDVLQLAVKEITEKLLEYPALYDVVNSFESASEEMRFELKPGAEKLGLTVASVMQQVRQAYYGEEAQRLPRNGQDVRVMVRYERELRRSPESLRKLRIRTNDGREVPLMSVVNVHYAPGLRQIDHRDGKRSVSVSAYLKEPVRGEIMEDLQKNFLPEWKSKYYGIESDLIGEAEDEQEFIAEMTRLLSLAFLAMYCLLAVAFKSYSQPILILVAIPFAALGAMFGHFILSMPLSLYSYFGIVAAAGVVVNDNLVLIDRYNHLRLEGVRVVDAIHEAAVSRFRPILVTSVTTFVGLVPLMLERSTQAAFLKPIVVSLTYGVVLAFFVTLFLVPAMLVIGAHYTDRRQHLWQSLKQKLGGDTTEKEAEKLEAR